MISGKLTGKVCLVTGATRGIGKGIALQLAENGGKVYITGRTLDSAPDAQLGGSLRETADEINARGGFCVAVQCDHTNDEDIERLFQMIKDENNGQLDILVNTAFSGINYVLSNVKVPFWEQPISGWDTVNRVGLRDHYICASYAAKLMVPRRRGLIVNISSDGGLIYTFGALYGIGREACDRMAVDCGYELKKHNVAFVSLWPGYVPTETVGTFTPGVSDTKTSRESNINMQNVTEFKRGESAEFPGQCIVELAVDRNLMKKSGKVLFTYDLSREYRLQDKEGFSPTDVRAVKLHLDRAGHRRLARLCPGFVRLPKWMMAATKHKF